LLAASVTSPAAQVAPQPPPAPSAPAPPATPEAPLPPAPDLPEAPPVFDDVFDARGQREAVRIGQDLNIAAGDAVRDALVVFGDATVAGQVDDDLVIILGTLRLAGTAAIGGNLIAIGTNVVAEPGVIVRRDLVVIGGDLDSPTELIPGGEHVVIGGGIFGGWLAGIGPYFARGLLWGRVIVPDLGWNWGFVALFFLVYLAINMLFEGPVRGCAATLRAKPLTAFGVGLLVLLLVGPVSLLLAVSVIGLAVVPFVVCALLAGWIVGKVAVARWIGMSIVAEEEDVRTHAARSFVIGFVLIAIAYMIPVLGIITWSIVGVLGLGTASLTFISAYRRENPRPVAPPAAPPPPVPAPYTPPAGGAPQVSPPLAYEALPPSPSPGAPIPAVAGAAVGSAGLAATMPRALFRDRLAAFVLDIILVAITVNVLDGLLLAPDDAVFMPLLLIYHIGFWTWKQTTVGGIICQLRVVRVDGAPLSFADALVRGLAAIFSLAVLFIGALWMLRDPESQTWHDKIAGTYVVKVPRNWPL
jgi:uncharacterized RDD family membrane protein YckC